MNSNVAFCLEMLPKVSRTFAPTIRMLPAGLDVPVTVAYLLCRIADTVEDSAVLKLQNKKMILQKFIKIFEPDNYTALDQFMEVIRYLPENSEDEKLAHNLPKVMDVYYTFSDILKKHISFWVIEMSKGMHKYAQSRIKRKFVFLASMRELDEYMYYVAGTVGYMLTELFSFYSKKITPPVKERLNTLAESFGKGLQMVNIIRDMTGDLKRGQSYIPEELLKKYKLDRQTIFQKENADKAQKLFNELIQKAVKHLDAALDYIMLIPKEEKQIRLFCMLPVFWAMRTLQKIQENTLSLLENDKIKIPRKIIKKEYYLAFINANSNRLTRWHYERIKKQVAIIAASG